MNELARGSCGIYQWFLKEPLRLRPLSSIDQRCTNILQSGAGHEEQYLPRSLFFLPLLRSGVIDFYGEGKFGLTPTCAIRGADHLLVINGPPALLQDLKGESKVSHPGITCIPYYPGQLRILDKWRVPHYPFSAETIWSRITPLKDVIKRWNRVEIDDISSFEYFDYRWKRASSADIPGIYRRSSNVYSQRYFRSSEQIWYIIPNQSSNVDAFNQAVLCGKIQSKKPIGLIYSPYKKELEIKELFFPIITERVLLLNTLLRKPAMNSSTRIYDVDKQILSAITKYTSNLLQYVE